MAYQVGPAVVGGLIVRNGKLRGSRVPLKLPVTVIGSGEGCDLRLTAEGIIPFHCVIAVTPAGPTIRTWKSESTLINNKPTTAAVLKHGDELRVGPCVFQIAWFGEIETENEPETSTEGYNENSLASDAEFSLQEREAALNEQEKQLAELLDGKQRQVQELLSQLADGRDKFSIEREQARIQLVGAGMVKEKANHALAEAEAKRQKGHLLYRKLILRAKKQRLEFEKTNQTVADQLKNETKQLEQRRNEFETTKVKTLADLANSKQRLQDAWQMLQDGQRRLHDDRKAAEKLLAEYQAGLDQREVELHKKDVIVNDAHARMEMRVGELQTEIAGLETRAMHTSIAVQELEQKRVQLEADIPGRQLQSIAPVIGLATTPASVAVLKFNNGQAANSQDSNSKSNMLVPSNSGQNAKTFQSFDLNPKKDRSFDELLKEVTTREQELERETKAVVLKKNHFDQLNQELADQRAVLVAQFTKLAAAARLWQQAEYVTAGELEQLASNVEVRERAVMSREQKLLQAENSTRLRERELWAFRVKLEGWQAGLTAHESQWYAQRDQADAEFERKREHLAKWESSLETLCKTWNELRTKERDAFLADVEFWKQDRESYLQARELVDREQKAVAEQAKALAAQALAVEELKNGTDEKRLRVVKKRWESHFKRFEKLWEVREKATSKLAITVGNKVEEFKKQARKLGEDKAKIASDKQAWQVTKLANERLASEKDSVITLITARARRSDRELHELRAEVERVSSVLLSQPMPTGEETLVSLKPARAA